MIWLIGCDGMLGKEVAKYLKENKLDFVGTDKEVDITNPEALDKFQKKLITSFYSLDSTIPDNEKNIQWIINCAAFTNIDEAENDKEYVSKVNAEGPLNIARIARKIGAKLIHISTDYVFSGKSTKPYNENMSKDPICHYGLTKSIGEYAIEKEMVQYFIIRTSWMYGFGGNNFVYKMINAMNSNEKVTVVNDQLGSPTFAEDLAELIITIITKTNNAKGFIGSNSTPAFGIYHYSNEGCISWYDFANAIYKYGKKAGLIANTCQIIPCKSSDYKSAATRPLYTFMDKTKIKKEFKIKIPYWQKSLKEFLKNKKLKKSEFINK